MFISECPRESFRDGFLHAGFLLRAKEPPGNSTLDGVEQLQPVFQNRLGQWFPLIEASFPDEEFPSVANSPRINFSFYACLGPAFPTYFRFAHGLGPVTKN
ncbi:MAG: hypothetical protein HY735_21445 [Verrucomicrobia bacterium]|nr:hypothetical protein [Verrucomicrobiota bacterium]